MPPTANLDERGDDVAPLDYCPRQARSRPLRVAMSNSFGFGGTNVALLFRRHAASDTAGAETGPPGRPG